MAAGDVEKTGDDVKPGERASIVHVSRGRGSVASRSHRGSAAGSVVGSKRQVGGVERVLWKLALEESAIDQYADDLSLKVVARFREPDKERLFDEQCRRSYAYRSPIIGTFLFSYILLTGPTCHHLLSDGIVGLTSTLTVTREGYVTAWQIGWIVSLCFAFILIISYRFSFGRRVPELTSYLMMAPWPCFQVIWAFYMGLDATLNTADLIGHVTGWTAVQAKLWSDTIQNNVCFIIITFIDAWMISRSKYSFSTHVFYLALFALSKIQAVFTFKDFQGHHISAVIWVGISQALLGCGLIAQAYIGRLRNEIRERIAFISVEKDKESLKELRNSQKKKRKGHGAATVIEKLLFSVKKAQTEILASAFQNDPNGDPQLLEVNGHLDDCMDILLTSDNLYTVGIGAGEATGTELQEDDEFRFLNMYIGKHQGGAEGGGVGVEAGGADLVVPYSADAESYFEKLVPEFHSAHLGEADDIGYKIGVDMLHLYKSRENILFETGMLLLGPRMKAFETDRRTLGNYLFSLQSRYYNNPYHNRGHGAMVAHMSHVFSYMLRYHTNDEPMAALILAALGHDSGHPGRNNQFVVHSQTLLFQYYPTAWLENFHCYLTFRHATISAETNVFKNLSLETYRKFRKNIIDLIMSTDMAEHFGAIGRFRVRRSNEKFDPNSNEDDLWSVYRMVIKLADLSHIMVDWKQHLEWSLRVTTEFYLQGDMEKQTGHDISPLCDRTAHADFAKSQSGFVQFVVLPLANELSEIDMIGQLATEVNTKLVFNRNKWEMLKEKGEVLEIPDDIPQKVTPNGFEDACMCVALLSITSQDFHFADPMQHPYYLKLTKLLGSSKAAPATTQTDGSRPDSPENRSSSSSSSSSGSSSGSGSGGSGSSSSSETSSDEDDSSSSGSESSETSGTSESESD